MAISRFRVMSNAAPRVKPGMNSWLACRWLTTSPGTPRNLAATMLSMVKMLAVKVAPRFHHFGGEVALGGRDDLVAQVEQCQGELVVLGQDLHVVDVGVAGKPADPATFDHFTED